MDAGSTGLSLPPSLPSHTHSPRFSRAHGFTKPNDLNALNLMNTAARAVMKELPSEIVLAYGDSDEYRYPIPSYLSCSVALTPASFLLPRHCKLYNRREFKIVSAF